MAWMFSQQGVIRVAAGSRDPEELALELLEIVDVGDDGDIRADGDAVLVLTSPTRFESVRDSLTAAGHTLEFAEVTMEPSTSISLDASQAPAVLRLLEALEDHDDVQR